MISLNFKGHYALANLTLVFTGLGLIISFPFRQGFGGGLAFSAFSAGTIAGLADWFAVTALFRKPLGIRPGRILRTEIIPQNRERIFQSLTEMVEHLLSQEILLEKLKRYHVARFLVNYLSEPQAQSDLNLLLASLIEHLEPKQCWQTAPQTAHPLLSEKKLFLELEHAFKELLLQSRERGFDLQAASFLSQQLHNLASRPEVFAALQQIIAKAYHTYETNHPARKWVDTLLPSPLDMAKGIQEAILEFLSGSEPLRFVRAGLDAYLSGENGLRTSALETVLGNASRLAGLFSQPDIHATLQGGMQKLLASGAPALLRTFQEQPTWLDALDQFLKSSLRTWIQAHHATLSQMVKAKLGELTGSELSRLIELKAGNDLQMIRINGSLIGGLAGILFYFVSTWL